VDLTQTSVSTRLDLNVRPHQDRSSMVYKLIIPTKTMDDAFDCFCPREELLYIYVIVAKFLALLVAWSLITSHAYGPLPSPHSKICRSGG